MMAIRYIRMVAWRTCRFRPPKSLIFCVFGMLFGMSSTLILASLKRMHLIPICDFDIINEPNKHQLLLVGIMSAAKFVDSRAYSIWETWAKIIPGKVIFFVGENTVSVHKELPLVRLKGVDDTYPPQKKSFAMLRYMAENHLNDFEWFMRADDDLYVRGDKLEHFLRSIDSDKPHLIGQAGLGNSAEYGQLSLGERDNYCMGGPGVVLSKETLRIVAPHLRSCLMELLTQHEDVEVGRCVRKHVGISCTWNYEMNKLFHNNQTLPDSYLGDLSEVYPAITLHPVKKQPIMKRMYVHDRELALKELQSLKVTLESQKLSRKRISLTTHSAENISDLIHWDFIASNYIMYCVNRVNCPKHTVDANIRSAMSSVVTKMYYEFKSNAEYRDYLLQYKGLQYGYIRIEPRYGIDYMLDMSLLIKKFKKPRRTSLPLKKHMYIRQFLGPIMATNDSIIRKNLQQRTQYAVQTKLQKQPKVFNWPRAAAFNENAHIYIIVPLSGRPDTFERFTNSLINICADKGGFSLTIVYFSTGTKDDDTVDKLIHNLMNKISAQVVRMGLLPFSRGLALANGAAIMQSDALLFFTDVDMMFNWDTLDRIRLNTIRGAQVYFPIVFSEYSSNYWSKDERRTPNHLHYSSRHGYFRHFGYGLASMFKSDLDYVGGLNTSIKGWGLEDVELFEKFVKSPLRILRAPEPELVHIHHEIHCSKTLPATQYEMCIGSKLASTASLDYLVDRIS